MSTKYKHGDRVPSGVLATRLDELSDAITLGGEPMSREFTRRIPAELDRDADLVLSQAADRIRELEGQLETAERAQNELRKALVALTAEAEAFASYIKPYGNSEALHAARAALEEPKEPSHE